MAEKKPMGLALLLAGKPGMDDEKKPMDSGDDDSKAPLEAAASDLIDAVKSGDTSGVMDALEAAFMFLDAQQPHDEGSEGE